MMISTLNTTIKWIDKSKKVGGMKVRFQMMHGKEVAVFDKSDLKRLIKDVKRLK